MQETTMPHAPVRAAPRPLFDLLSDALLALLEPSAADASRGECRVPARHDRYALFDVPTYQRRRMRIDGLEAAGEANAHRVVPAADAPA
jgi:hypothetical protein